MLDTLLSTLLRLWLYDVSVFSQPWLYIWLCIPAGAYLCFFVAKWCVLTLPVWLPISLIVRAFKS